VTRNVGLLDRMMAQLHVRDCLATHPNGSKILRTAAIRCMMCREADACKAWLDNSDRLNKAPKFCNNRDLFEQMKY